MNESFDNELNRREVLKTGAGYALAVSPITAWAITTPKKGLNEGDILIPVGDLQMPGYWAMPETGGSHPVVLVIQEIFGIHEYIKDVCRRLAKAGYLAVAPSLYFRQGDATKVTDIDTLRSTMVSKTPQAQVMSDLDATTAWLSTQRKADVKRMGITGFCWGGNVTWMYASQNPKLKAGVAWYGRLSGEVSEASPKFPIDAVNDLTVPVLGLYGEKDDGIPQESVEKMRLALRKAGNRSEIIVFKGAAHGFHADYRPSYNRTAAKEGWTKMLSWFKKHGL